MLTMGLKYEELYCVLLTSCLLRFSADAVSNSQFNANIRDYAVNNDNSVRYLLF